MRPLKDQGGFTMMELVIVMVILGVLAAVAVPKFYSMVDEAKREACVANQKSIENAILNELSVQLMDGDQSDIASVVTDYDTDGHTWFTDNSKPECPSDGTYDITTGSSRVRANCSVSGH